MKIHHRFLSLIFFLFVAVSNAHALTIGMLIEQGKQAANDLIVQGQNSANDVLINAGNTILATVNGMAVAYEDQLEKTVDSLSEERKLIFRDMEELFADLDNRLDRVDDISNAAGTVVSSVPGAKKLPVITKVDFPTLHARESQIIKLKGFNLELWEFELKSSTLEIENTETKTSTELAFRVKDISDNNNWVNPHSIDVVFKVKQGIIFKKKKDMDFIVSGASIDWGMLQAGIKYKERSRKKVYAKNLVKRSKSHPRNDRSWSYRVDYVPTSPYRVDTTSFNASWWEHKECSNGNTFYTLESIDEVQGVRVSMQGREESGIDKDCGASLTYTVKIFKYENENITKITEWSDINPDKLISYPDANTELVSIVVRDKNSNKEIAEITPTSNSRYPFLTINHDSAAKTVRVGG